MKVILTGASSFTGYWFIKALSTAGHEVTATLSGSANSCAYESTRRVRLDRLRKVCNLIFGAPFGSERFLEVVAESGRIDVLCHHWAEVRDYRSPDFDALAALGKNTKAIERVLKALVRAGGQSFVLTGSVFEPGEGAGNLPLRAFSPYGLSKGLTASVCAYNCERVGMPLRKFVIPNPFGPLEEARFTDYLMRNWFSHQTASVTTPAYVRDNIHVSLLAKAYAAFVAGKGKFSGDHLGPIGYAETQGAFAERMARECRSRLGLACDLLLQPQTEFPEPLIRTNRDLVDRKALDWSENDAWDEFAAYYQEKYTRQGTNDDL
jgi:nucleoside-diphosphate-sugar epimerase